MLQGHVAAKSPRLGFGGRLLGFRLAFGSLFSLGLVGLLDFGQPLSGGTVLLGALFPLARFCLPVRLSPCGLDRFGWLRRRGAFGCFGHSDLPCGIARSPCGFRAATSTHRMVGSL